MDPFSITRLETILVLISLQLPFYCYLQLLCLRDKSFRYQQLLISPMYFKSIHISKETGASSYIGYFCMYSDCEPFYS